MMGSTDNSKNVEQLSKSVNQQMAETGKVDTITTIGLVATLISSGVYVCIFGFLSYAMFKLVL
jgi:hypothetical protein